MARRILVVMLVLGPLVGGIALLRSLPVAALATEPPPGLWRFDPLALVGCFIVAVAAARPQPLLLALRTTTATICVMLALLANVPALQLLMVVVASLLLFDGLGPRWFVALALYGFVTLGAAWLVALPSTTPLYAMIVLSFIGCGGLPSNNRRRTAQAEIVVRPLWIMVLLRTLLLEPWPNTTIVLATTGGTLALAVIAYTLVRSASRIDLERLSALALMMAFVAVAQNTTLGVVAALWATSMYAILVAFRPIDAPPTLMTACIALGVAAWWTAGAAAAGGGFLAAGIVCAVSAVACVAVMLGSPRSSGMERWMSPVLLVALALGTPWATATFWLPVAQQLGAGLTALGLVDVWPFIGASALDAGHRRATLIPSVAVVCLLVVAWAAVWLLARVSGRLHPAPDTFSNANDRSIETSRVWWLK